jgi:hypothetical protein
MPLDTFAKGRISIKSNPVAFTRCKRIYCVRSHSLRGPSGTVGVDIAIQQGNSDGAGLSQSSSPSASLTLNAHLDDTVVVECGVLILLYNLERTRSRMIAKNALNVLEAHPDLDAKAESLLPGLKRRLKREPEGILEYFRSFELMLDIASVLDPGTADEVKKDIKSIVGLFASNVGGRDRDAMSKMSESPMWNSISWKLMNIILQKDVLELLDSGGLNESEEMVLRLCCNSKTAGQGLPMSVSMRVGVKDETGVVLRFLKERLGESYFGKGLGEISTSVWSAVRLKRESSTEDERCEPSVSGTLKCGDLEVEILNLNDFDSVVMTLAYLTSDCGDGRTRGKNQIGAVMRDVWVPSDARIKWSRSQGTPSESRYRVMTESKDVEKPRGTIREADDCVQEMDNVCMEGVIDVLDALRAIDGHFVGII